MRIPDARRFLLGALAVLLPHEALGQSRAPERDIVFECPCSAALAPGGTLEVALNVRSFRGSRSMALGLQVQRGEDLAVSAEREGRAPLVPDGLPALSRLFPPGGGTARPAFSDRADDGILFVNLVEFYGGQSAGGAGGAWAAVDQLVLWPVPGGPSSGQIRYVDILTDSDGDGVGDVNEWIAAGWRPGGEAPAPDPARDPGSTPSGPSEIDMLWLHPASWGAEAIAEYRHSAAVAGHLFADSGVAFRLRPAGFVPVPDDAVASWAGPMPSVDAAWASAAAVEHGADVVHVAFGESGGGVEGRGHVEGVASGHFRLFGDPGFPRGPTSSSTPDGGAFVIAHELGHVFGLAHSAAQGEAYGTFRHSRGHYLRRPGERFLPAGDSHGTVMSYGNSSMTPVFSSPDSGLCEPFGPCGLPASHAEGADAVSSLNVLRFQIAGVRPPKRNAGGGDAGGPALHDWFGSASVQAAFEDKLGKPARDLTEEDMRGVRELNVTLTRRADGTDINLAGIERAVNLADLTLRGEGAGLRLSDLSPLADLPVEVLSIQNVGVDDLRALSRLAELRVLALRGAGISDASLPALVRALGGVEGLSQLYLYANAVSNAAPLCGLADLPRLNHFRGSLGLARNAIRDARPLKCFAELGRLDASFNDIGTASMLAAVNAMGGLAHLDIGGNPLSFDGFLSGVREGFFSARWQGGVPQPNGDVFLKEDVQRSLGLRSLGISDLGALAAFMAGLEGFEWWIVLDGNPVQGLAPIARKGLWPLGGYLSLSGLGLTEEALGPGGHIARIEEWGVLVANAWPEEPDRTNAFADGALASRVKAQKVRFGELAEGPLPDSRLEALREIHAPGRGISGLAGIEHASQLEFAHLASNRISDLSPLLGLKRLKGVGLDGNPLSEAALNEQVPELLAQVGAADCGWQDSGVCGSVALGTVSWTPIAGRDGARYRTDGYFRARLGVADAAAISFSAETDRAALRPSVSADGLLRIRPVRLAGPATVTVTAKAGADAVALDFHIVSPKAVPLFLADRGPAVRHGFLRVVNHADLAGDVRITARDGSGAAFGPILLSLEGRQAIHLNSHDLESGNPAKGLREGLGDGRGDWRLTIEGRLNAEALAYVRTTDGFVTAMHDVAPNADGGDRELLFFNPGSNHRQESVLRLINDGGAMEGVRLTAIDDAGAEGAVVANVPAGEALRFTAAELEGGAAPGLSGALGDGSGKWRLRIEAGPDITAMGLLETPTGHLANLSAPPAEPGADGIVRLPLFLSASEPSREGFMRVVNRSERAGTIAIAAFDDAGREHGPVRLSLGPREARHLNSGDLESGNAAKGLEGSLGAGSGHWRLELDGGGLDFEALAYVRTNDGFVTAMHEEAPGAGGTRRIAFLNPGSNHRQESVLRLVNGSGAPASITITAVDDAGRAGGSLLTLELPAGQAEALTAKALEAGPNGLLGSLGDGRGKWRLCVEADGPITAMSLLETPTGHLTNLSGSPDMAECTAGGPEG